VFCQVVQHFTELGLNVRRARISSDGGWFVDGACSCCTLAPPSLLQLAGIKRHSVVVQSLK